LKLTQTAGEGKVAGIVTLTFKQWSEDVVDF
jgi:hypothetical protein